MRFLKNKIAQANIIRNRHIKKVYEHSLQKPLISNSPKSNCLDKPKQATTPADTKKRTRIPGFCLTSETSRVTKNIVKNYGKAICKFITSHLALPYLNVFLKKENVSLIGFINFVKSSKNHMDGIHRFRSVLMEDKKDDQETAAYRRIFKELSEIFIKFFSHNWIFDSKIVHKEAHLMFRFKMLRRIRSPELFTYLKDTKRSGKKQKTESLLR